VNTARKLCGEPGTITVFDLVAKPRPAPAGGAGEMEPVLTWFPARNNHSHTGSTDIEAN